MSVFGVAFTMPPAALRWQRYLIFSALARIAIFAALMAGIFLAIKAALAALGWDGSASPIVEQAVASIAPEFIGSVVAYAILVYAIERRRMWELAARNILTHGFSGLLIGSVAFSAVVGILWLAGSYHVARTESHIDWAFGFLAAGIGAGVAETIVIFGVLFRVVEEGTGTWWALIISALLFGSAHLLNPSGTILSYASLVIEGTCLALIYHISRSLWLCIGLHIAWNVTEGLLYGLPISGIQLRGVLVSKLTGPDWLSGGAFGAEASIVTVAITFIASAAMLMIAFKRHSFVLPPWRRRPAPINTQA